MRHNVTKSFTSHSIHLFQYNLFFVQLDLIVPLIVPLDLIVPLEYNEVNNINYIANLVLQNT